MNGRRKLIRDVQAYDAEDDDQMDVEQVGDSKCKAEDDAKHANPLPVDTCTIRQGAASIPAGLLTEVSRLQLFHQSHAGGLAT